MRSFASWLFIIAIWFIAIASPIVFVLGLIKGIKMPISVYVTVVIEFAVLLIYISYSVLKKKHTGQQLKKKLITVAVTIGAVSIVLGVVIAPLIKFDGIKDDSFSSSYSSTYHSYGGSGYSSRNSGSGGSSFTSTYRSTPKPRVTSRPAYAGNYSYSPSPRRTVNPEDHDIELYYLDYQDEFEDEDDAWDDFEDDEDVWDDY